MRKDPEKCSGEPRRRAQFIIDNAPVGIIQLDEQRRFVNFNTAFYQFLGYSREELEYKTMFDVTHPGDVEASRRISEGFRDPAFRVQLLEKRYVRKDGAVVWGRVTSRQLTDQESGEKFLFTVIEDITDLKARESDLKRAEAELGQFFSVSLDLLLVIDASGLIKRVNDAACSSFGYLPSEVEGHNMMEFIHPDDSETSQAQLARLAMGFPSLRFESRCRMKSGEYRLVSWNSAPDANTKLIYASGRDITDKRQNELKLTYSAKMASLGEMAGGIAHEINNPLAIILGKVSNLKGLLKEPSFSRDEAYEELDRVERTGFRIAKIIRGLKAFSRNGEADPMHRVPLYRIVEETLELCAERLKSRQIDLRVTGDRTLVVSCRPGQLSQVLMNLISNSYDAIESLPTPWIRIDLSRGHSGIELSVEDCGLGISDALRGKIMQPFFTTKEVGKGTGLGLSIAKGLVETHGGELRYDDRSRHTRFVVELPHPDR